MEKITISTLLFELNVKVTKICCPFLNEKKTTNTIFT